MATNVMLPLELREELDRRRIHAYQTNDDTGMGEIFEDRPASPSFGIFTASFCREWCDSTPGYVWRPL